MDIITRFAAIIGASEGEVLSAITDIKKDLESDYNQGDKELIDYRLIPYEIDTDKNELQIKAEVFYEDMNHVYDDNNPGENSKITYEYWLLKDLDWYII
jgi:hypothetical protein